MSRFLLRAKGSLLIVGLFFFIGCGHLTAPKPLAKRDPFVNLEVIQKGNRVRLSWEMKISPPLDQASRQFYIEDLVLKPYCIDCKPSPIKTFIVPFPSEHFIISGRKVYFYPQVDKDLNIHVFRVTFQTFDGDNIGKTEIARFTGFVDFPELSSLQWEWLSNETFPSIFPKAEIPDHLEIIEILKLSWERQLERIELILNQRLLEEREVLLEKREVYYRVNIYKTRIGALWPEKPINSDPIDGPLFFDFQTQCKFMFNESGKKLLANKKIPQIDLEDNPKGLKVLPGLNSNNQIMDTKKIRNLKDCFDSQKAKQFTLEQITEASEKIRAANDEEPDSFLTLFLDQTNTISESRIKLEDLFNEFKKPENGPFLYQIRLVDSKKNESRSSKAYTIKR